MLDAQGNPVPGQIVIAISYGGLSGIAPMGFRNKLENIPNKKLLNPVEGSYAEFLTYLQGYQSAFTPLKTD